jgi:hypothetical protein
MMKDKNCLFLTIMCEYAISYKKIRGTPETLWRHTSVVLHTGCVTLLQRNKCCLVEFCG